jgi:hypothetical protein
MSGIFVVYEHLRPDTGEVFYVGKGTLSRSTKKSSRNIWWRRIVAKAGGFLPKIAACGLDEKQALDLEVSMIAAHKRCGTALCNLTDGGDGVSGYKFSQEMIERIAAQKRGRPAHNRGSKASLEAREKMRRAKLGKKQSQEHIEKCRAANMGRIFPESVRQKIAASNTGKKHSEETKMKLRRPVFCITTGQQFSGVKVAAAALEVWSGNIVKCCAGELKQTGGFKFRYVEDVANV